MAVPVGLWGQSEGDYRTTTAASGNWNTVANWQRYTSGAWVAASAYPQSSDGTIFIRGDASIISSTIRSIDQVIVFGTLNCTADLTVLDGTGTDMTVTGTGAFLTSAGITLSGSAVMTVLGTCQINAGGYFNQSPTYSGTSSTLVYNTGGAYTTYNEWTGGGSTDPLVGSGVPGNITLQNSGTNLTLAGARGTPGTITIGTGTHLILNAVAGDLYIGGNFIQNGGLPGLINNSRIRFPTAQFRRFLAAREPLAPNLLK